MALFKSQRKQRSFFDTQIYDRLIPKDHLLVRLNRVLDWSFIEQATRDFYQRTGRRACSPVVLFKMLLLAYLFDISERRIEDECNYNMLYKYFLGLEADEKAPDHSTLSRFRDRLGLEGFQTIFNRIVALARQQGVVSDRLRIVDSTHTLANVDILRASSRAEEAKPSLTGQDDDPPDDNTILPGSPDPDARFGRKSKQKKFYGYKQHLGVDADSDFITHVATSGGNISDHDYLEAMATGPPPQGVTADKLYDSRHHHERLQRQGITSYIIRKRTSPIPRDSEYQRAIQLRKRIERVFAVMKKYHSGGRARYWGQLKVGIQHVLVATVYDLKLLAHHLTRPPGIVSLKP
jgi:IS5 family transposase